MKCFYVSFAVALSQVFLLTSVEQGKQEPIKLCTLNACGFILVTTDLSSFLFHRRKSYNFRTT